MQPAAAAHDGYAETGVSTDSTTGSTVEERASARRRTPLPLRPRGGFGAYLNELRRERGLTIRQLAAAAGVHHTYVSKLERGDRQAPDEAVTEALAAALGATPAQVDQLRWRAGLTPHGSGAPGQDDPTMTLVAEALGNGALTPAQRDRLRQTIARIVQEQEIGAGVTGSAGMGRGAFAGAPVPAPVAPPVAQAAPSASPEAPPDGRTALLAGLLGGWQTLDEAAAELRVAPAYLWELAQTGHLRAWALPGAPPNSPAGIRLRRDDVLALLQPVQPMQPYRSGR